MANRMKKKSSKKSTTTLRLKNPSLAGDFEIFLPTGWKLSKSTAKIPKNSKQAPAKKTGSAVSSPPPFERRSTCLENPRAR
jgi:hypothetical protein